MADPNPNERVLLVHEDDDDDDEIDIGRAISVMFHNWKRLLIITASVGVIGALGIQFIYNRPKVNYVCSFNTTASSYNEGKSIDGKEFNANDYISSEALTYAKNSNKDEFSSVDIDKMLSSNKISISSSNVTGSDTAKVISTNCTLTIAKTCFSSETIAKDFIQALCDYPLEYNLSVQKNLSYTTNFDNYIEATTYEIEISSLENQLNWLDEKYAEIVTDYSDFALTNEANKGKRISTVQKELKDDFENKLSLLSAELSEKGYAKNEEELDSLLIEKKDLQNKLEASNLELEKLQAQVDHMIDEYGGTNIQSLGLDAYNERIAALIQVSANYETKIKAINRKLHITSDDEIPTLVEAPDSFVTALQECYDGLYSATANFKDNNEPEALKDIIQTTYSNASIVSSSGGLNKLITFGAPFALGLVASMVVNLIVDHKYMNEPYPEKKKKEKKA